jgi:hypothetical protein
VPIRPVAAFLPLVLATACASPGPYPSLAPRAIERGQPGGLALAGCPVPADPAAALGGPASVAPPAPRRDAQLRARVNELIGTARAGQAEFAQALPQAERSAARAGAPNSETWIEAQQELSRLEAARARTADALSALDDLSLRPASVPVTNPEDQLAVAEALEDVRALALAQDQAIARLAGRLGSP